MSFWKKLFGKKEGEVADRTDSNPTAQKSEANGPTLKTADDLERLVKPLVRKTTKIEVQPASRPSENSQMISHFGGHPYFEEGEKWPTNKSGASLDFVCQIFNEPNFELPESIALFQLYYDWEESPWETENDGWLVKLYKTRNQEKMISIDKPGDLDKSKYCEIKFVPGNSLPDWEGISVYSKDASKLSSILSKAEPWASYEMIVTRLIGEQNYQSQLGGYPRWVQGESTPKDRNGKPMKLLFQIDSEDNAGIMWGDVGLIYVFHDPEDNRIEFILQCH